MLARSAFKTMALCLIILAFTWASGMAQDADSSKNLGNAGNAGPQLQFVGQETYEVNGATGTRYRLSVRNRSDHPDFLWMPSGKPCGANENSSRALVEVFGSPGDKRLAGFCSLRSSEELSHLWFPVQSGEKGPQCVYLVMTDQQTGKKYESNPVCSRSFTVVRGRLSGGNQQPAPARDQGWIEVGGFQIPGTAENDAQLGSRDKPATYHPLPNPVRILETRPGDKTSSKPEAAKSRQAGPKERMAEREKENVPGQSGSRDRVPRVLAASNIPARLPETRPGDKTSSKPEAAKARQAEPKERMVEREKENDPTEPTHKLNATAVNNHLQRHQMAAFLVRAFGQNPPPPAMQRFTDVPPSHPSYNFIDRAVDLRIMQGCSRSKFCPGEPVRREQMAAFIIRAVGTFNPPIPATQRFTDVPPTNPYYAFIDMAASRKLIAACGGNTFCPTEPATHDQAAAALRKAFPSKSNSLGLKGGGESEAPAKDRLGNFEIQTLMSQSEVNEPGTSKTNVGGSRGKERVFNSSSRDTPKAPDSSDVPNRRKAGIAQPDLQIRQFLFPPTNDKALRVHVVNTGQSVSGACRLVLTVRKINGIAAGRITHVNVPVLAAGADEWLHIDVRSILPRNVSPQSTSFKLRIDATEIVVESNEANNEVWHNP